MRFVNHGYRARYRLIEGHLPNEYAGRDLQLAFHDIHANLNESRRSVCYLLVFRKEGWCDQCLRDDLSVRSFKIDNFRISWNFLIWRVCDRNRRTAEYYEYC